MESGKREFIRARGGAVRAFRDHWRKLADDETELNSRAETHWTCFLAGSTGAMRRWAARFYDKAHAKRLASLTPAAVTKQLAVWLDHAVANALDEYDEPAEVDHFLRRCVTTEYVLAFNGALYPFPGGSLYDDIYEYCAAGFSTGGNLSLYKSTGEPFGALERRSTAAGIKAELWNGASSAGDDEDWQITFDPESAPAQIDAYIWSND